MDPSDYALFVKIVRYLRANGWTSWRCRNADKSRQLQWDRHTLIVSAPEGYLISGLELLTARPDTMQQAADYLVVAGILPTAFASWEWKPTTVAQISEDIADRIDRRADEISGALVSDHISFQQYVRIKDETDGLRAAAGIAREYATQEG